jgi:hypothetical protein
LVGVRSRPPTSDLPKHPRTLTTLHNLALALEAREKYGEAERIFEDVLRLQTNIDDIGPDHPSTLATKHNLAVLLMAEGGVQQVKRAEGLLKQVRRAQVEQLGDDHDDTKITKANLQAARPARRAAAAPASAGGVTVRPRDAVEWRT